MRVRLHPIRCLARNKRHFESLQNPGIYEQHKSKIFFESVDRMPVLIYGFRCTVQIISVQQQLSSSFYIINISVYSQGVLTRPHCVNGSWNTLCRKQWIMFRQSILYAIRVASPNIKCRTWFSYLAGHFALGVTHIGFLKEITVWLWPWRGPTG